MEPSGHNDGRICRERHGQVDEIQLLRILQQRQNLESPKLFLPEELSLEFLRLNHPGNLLNDEPALFRPVARTSTIELGRKTWPFLVWLVFEVTSLSCRVVRFALWSRKDGYFIDEGIGIRVSKDWFECSAGSWRILEESWKLRWLACIAASSCAQARRNPCFVYHRGESPPKGLEKLFSGLAYLAVSVQVLTCVKDLEHPPCSAVFLSVPLDGRMLFGDPQGPLFHIVNMFSRFQHSDKSYRPPHFLIITGDDEEKFQDESTGWIMSYRLLQILKGQRDFLDDVFSKVFSVSDSIENGLAEILQSDMQNSLNNTKPQIPDWTPYFNWPFRTLEFRGLFIPEKQ